MAATGAAAEVIGIVRDPAAGQPRHEIVALVGDGDLLADLASRLSVPLFDSLDRAEPESAVAFAGGGLNLEPPVAAAVSRLRLEPVTLIHRQATIGPWVSIGRGSVVSPGARITGNVSLGEFCQIHTGAIASHDDVLGDNVTLSPSATLCGGVTIGDRSTVFAAATVMPGVTIGSDATVGAGALVNRDVADGATVVGVPAKPLPAR